MTRRSSRTGFNFFYFFFYSFAREEKGKEEGSGIFQVMPQEFPFSVAITGTLGSKDFSHKIAFNIIYLA